MEGENLVIRKNGQRQCKQCARDRATEQRRGGGVVKRKGPDCSYEVPARETGYTGSNEPRLREGGAK